MNDVISSIPQGLKFSLAKLLDRKKEPNWRTFVAKTPGDIYSFKKGELETIRLAILKPNGSPTLQLIEKLGERNVQVCHFIEILEKLPKDENVYKALDLFLGGTASVKHIIYIFLSLCILCEILGSYFVLFTLFTS